MDKEYYQIIKRYEKCLSKYGDSHLAVEWPNLKDANKRYAVMLDLINYDGNILDFGCGCSGLLDYMIVNNIEIPYSGLDISEEFISLSKKKYPNINYYKIDVLNNNFNLNFDFVIMNGVLTVKDTLTFDSMWDYSKKLLKKVFNICNKGMAFNLMSKNVDWERDDLFHMPIDLITSFLYNNLSDKYIIRHDYGLYEYTIYLYKKEFDF